jgi:hypothetical protein
MKYLENNPKLVNPVNPVNPVILSKENPVNPVKRKNLSPPTGRSYLSNRVFNWVASR